jgi:hypothetical protein
MGRNDPRIPRHKSWAGGDIWLAAPRPSLRLDGVGGDHPGIAVTLDRAHEFNSISADF